MSCSCYVLVLLIFVAFPYMCISFVRKFINKELYSGDKKLYVSVVNTTYETKVIVFVRFSD